MATDAPLRAYIQGSGGYSWLSGPFVRAEAGWKPLPWVSVFTFGQWDKVEPMVGGGVRWDF